MRYYYHLTHKDNMESIQKNGLQPHTPKRFAPLSPEAHDGRAKIFLLPVLNGRGMKGFISEWWHGSPSDIIVLRCKLGKVFHSKDPYYRTQECWVYDTIPPECLEYQKIHEKRCWRSLEL